MDDNIGWRCPFGDVGEDDSHIPQVVMTFHCNILLRLLQDPSIMGYGSNQCDDISPRIDEDPSLMDAIYRLYNGPWVNDRMMLDIDDPDIQI